MAVKKHPLVAGLHVAVGDFNKAVDLLKKQLAVGNFEPLRQLFVDVYTLGKMKLHTLPHTSPLTNGLRSYTGLPQVVLSLTAL
jgi:hypothetical protein